MVDVQQEIRSYIVDKILFDDGEILDEDLSFQESGILDSTGFLELITFIEERFGIEISDWELIPENFDTLRKVAGFVQSKKQNNALDCNLKAGG
jgi:acyl carrier protein